MNSKYKSSLALAVLIPAIVLVSLSGCRRAVERDVVFEQTDYSLQSNWYESGRVVDPSLVDVFYILPTCVYDTKDDNGKVISRLADPDDPDHRQRMKPSYELAQSIFADSANFFSPYYKQVSLEVWMDGNDTIAKYLPYAVSEMKSAFKYYMDHFNNGRRFVLAGFSQGAEGVVELLKSLDSEQYSRLVAAYVVGYKVTEEDLKSPYVRPAQGADDTGVAIVYNSVASEDAAVDILSGDGVVCINPFSWSTSREPASYNGITATINSTGEYLVLEGVNPDDYYLDVMSRLTPRGNLHLGELTIYQDILRENVKLRMRQ